MWSPRFVHTFDIVGGGWEDGDMSAAVVSAFEGEELARCRAAVVEARRVAAASSAGLAGAAVRFADARIRAERARAGQQARDGQGAARVAARVAVGVPGPGALVAEEVSLLLREPGWAVARLLTRTRRLAGGLPTVWQACRRGEVDPEQARVVDRVARRATEAATIAAVEEAAVELAATHTPAQLAVALLRIVVRLEPEAFAARHRAALAERGVRVVQTADGIGYVTGAMTAADAAEVRARLTAAARGLGADDPRTLDQRKADIMADLLLGRLELSDDPDDQSDGTEGGDGHGPADPTAAGPGDGSVDDDRDEGVGAGDAVQSPAARSAGVAAAHDTAAEPGWLEVEDIDPDTGEYHGSRWVPINAHGEPLDHQAAAAPPSWLPRLRRRTRVPLQIGIVVPLSSLLGCDHTPGELADRSGFVPADTLRRLIADALTPDPADPTGRHTEHPTDHHTEVLFTRLLTDDGGRLLHLTELGRHPSRRLAAAIKLRAGTCRFPSCTVPADGCDCDHHEPVPRGPTSAANLDPLCRRHHRAKTFAWQASLRTDNAVDWTMPDDHTYRALDPPLPLPVAGSPLAR
jgi:Domain of unknown function (DUF222)